MEDAGPRRHDPNHLSPAEREQLLAMKTAEATSRAAAIGPYDLKPCNPNVIGALRDKGFASSRTVRPTGGSQFTAYWLTEAGVAKAVEVA